MHHLTIETMREYASVVNLVRARGVRRSPRGQLTYDAGPVTVTLTHPEHSWAGGTGRGVLPRIAAAEAVQLVGGFADPGLTRWSSPNFARYAEDEGHFHGAYGERVADQVEHVTRKLEDDPETRQAVVTLWDPLLDNQPGKRDYPCTVALHFSRRPGLLDMHVLMRSNDVWLGFPYDVFQFTQLQHTVARTLGLRAGVYEHTAWSLHLYEEHVALAEHRLVPGPDVVPVWCPTGLGETTSLGTTSARLNRRLARSLVYGFGPRDSFHRPLTESEVWYRDNLRGYVGSDHAAA